MPPPADAQPPLPAAPAVSPAPHRLLLAAIAALLIGYAALSHYSASSPDAKGLGAALSVGPVFLIGVILAWRWTRPLTALVIAFGLSALLYRYWPAIERNFQWGDLVQQCAIYGLLAATFARSLLSGRIPICTVLAEKTHGALTPLEIVYTQRATVVWAVFYALMTIAILVLFFVTSMRTWSLFVNFAAFGLMMLIGIVDHGIRRIVLPRHTGGGILAVIRRSLTG